MSDRNFASAALAACVLVLATTGSVESRDLKQEIDGLRFLTYYPGVNCGIFSGSGSVGSKFYYEGRSNPNAGSLENCANICASDRNCAGVNWENTLGVCVYLNYDEVSQCAIADTSGPGCCQDYTAALKGPVMPNLLLPMDHPIAPSPAPGTLTRVAPGLHRDLSCIPGGTTQVALSFGTVSQDHISDSFLTAYECFAWCLSSGEACPGVTWEGFTKLCVPLREEQILWTVCKEGPGFSTDGVESGFATYIKTYK